MNDPPVWEDFKMKFMVYFSFITACIFWGVTAIVFWPEKEEDE